MRRLLIALPVVFLAGCGPSSKDFGSSETGAARATVTVVRPTKADAFTQVIEQPGKVTAQEQTGLHAKIAGYIAEIKKDIGDTVEKDEVLITLALPEMESERNQKAAALDRARAQVTQAERAEDVARARVEEFTEAANQAKFSLERWEKEYARISKLAGSRDGVLDTQTKDETQRQRDVAQAAVKAAEAKIKSANADVRKATADVEAAQADVRLDEADLKRVESLLEYRHIKAPFAGVIAERNADTGHFAAPQATGRTNPPLLVIVKKGPPRIFLNIPEADAPWVKLEAPATVRFGGKELHGKVIRIAGALEPKERTLLTEIHLDDDKVALPFGAYVHTTIQVSHKDTRTIPASAVVVDKEQTFCYLVVQGKAVRTPIQAGLRANNQVEVLQKQVKNDGKVSWQAWDGEEKVISVIPSTLKDGQEVEVTEK
jgi:multidrug resistance efflux pump